MAQTVLNETQIPDVVTDSTMYGTGKTGDPLGISGTSLPYNFVTGSIAFADSAGFLIEDNKHLRYNSTLRSVRMGKDAPFNNFADLFPFFATAEFAGESIVNGVYAYGTGTSGLPLPGFGSYRSRGTPEAPTVVKKDDVLGSFYGTGYDGADFYNGGRVRFYADVDWTTGANRASRTAFLVIPSGTISQIEKMNLYGDSLNLINTGTYNVNGTPHTHTSPQILFTHGLNTGIAASTTSYLNLGNISGIQTAISNITVTRACTAQNLYFTTNSTQSATGSLVVALLKNNVATACVITIAAGTAANTFSNVANTISLVAGDSITLEIKNNATATSATVTRVAMELLF